MLFHRYGKSALQIAMFVVEAVGNFSVNINVATLSHPAALVKVLM